VRRGRGGFTSGRGCPRRTAKGGTVSGRNREGGTVCFFRAGIWMFVEFAWCVDFHLTQSVAGMYPHARVKPDVMFTMRFPHLPRRGCSVELRVATTPSDDFDGLATATFIASGAAQDATVEGTSVPPPVTPLSLVSRWRKFPPEYFYAGG